MPSPYTVSDKLLAYSESLREASKNAQDFESRATRLAIGPLTLQLHASKALWEHAFSAISHLSVEESEEAADWTVYAWQGGRPPTPPWSWLGHTLCGRRFSLPSTEYECFYHPNPGLMSWVDWPHRCVYVWYQGLSSLPFWEKALPLLHPLQSILHQVGVDLAHSAALAKHGRGILLAGMGGSGKSTTALLAAQAGWHYLADDFCALQGQTIVSLYSSAKVDWKRLAWLPKFQSSLCGDRDDEKALLLFEQSQIRMASVAPLTHIVLPQVRNHPTTELLPASPSEALRALAPSSLFIVQGQGPTRLARLAQAVRSVPCWHLFLGQDPEEIPACLEGLT